MAEKSDDFNLPNSIIVRLLKDAVPEGINVSKEARTAFARAASIFILYLTSCSNNFAQNAKRKTLNVIDIFEALDDIELGSFVEPLNNALEVFLAEKNKKVQTIIMNGRKKRNSDSGTSKDSPTDDLSAEVSDSIIDECD